MVKQAKESLLKKERKGKTTTVLARVKNYNGSEETIKILQSTHIDSNEELNKEKTNEGFKMVKKVGR